MLCCFQTVESVIPPKIEEGPANQTNAELLQEVTLTCEAIGEPHPQYSWFKVRKLAS